MQTVHPLPAIMIGGPPHSGKSVLAYQLTQTLRHLDVDHYLLRACPDGEGDWSSEADRQTVQMIRAKGHFTENFVAQVVAAINQRMMPLLVDVGGRPQPDQEAILAACSHAILIAPTENELEMWRQLAMRLGIPIVAELISSLSDADTVFATFPLLRARIFGLVRGRVVDGPVLQQLSALVRALLARTPNALRTFHLEQAPVETTVDLERLLETLRASLAGPVGRWQVTDLPVVLAYLPHDAPLAVYGRSTTWIYGALALHTMGQPFYQFDARLGWVHPPPLEVVDEVNAAEAAMLVKVAIDPRHSYDLLDIKPMDPYLDYHSTHTIRLPRLPLDPASTPRGVVISGRLPLWLLTGVVRAYADRPWLALYAPATGGAVVIQQGQGRAVGDHITMRP